MSISAPYAGITRSGSSGQRHIQPQSQPGSSEPPHTTPPTYTSIDDPPEPSKSQIGLATVLRPRDTLLKEHFSGGAYVDVPGLCKVATRAEIEAQGWSLNPGRYTGIAATDEDDEHFTEKLEELYETFTRLSDEADRLRAKVDEAMTGILSP